ncbi:MAG: hypothetical protein IJW21_08315 [Clostridia bacterium]|nr:hypothetical protein [Clostridia bacterium]
MVHGAILEKGERFYTFLDKVFDAIENKQDEYNWLITDCDLNITFPLFSEARGDRYCWIDGKELAEIVRTQKIQWIFAVLSGFRKYIPLEEVLKYPLPYADGYRGFWENPISLQHPLAEVEIVPWDSTITLLISKNIEIVDSFKRNFPLSENLAEYNLR